MDLYPDTSALIKLYHEEPNAEKLKDFLIEEVESPSLVISTLAITEFISAVWQKQRIAHAQNNPGYLATTMTALFETDIRLNRFIIADVQSEDYETACAILGRCNGNGLKLRTLDALHLAIAFELGKEIDVIVSCDKDFSAAAQFLDIPVKHIGQTPPPPWTPQTPATVA